MANEIEVFDEFDERVYVLNWDDLDNLPDFSDGIPDGTTNRTWDLTEHAVDFFAELKRLNETVAAPVKKPARKRQPSRR
jgi:hypothetical protein